MKTDKAIDFPDLDEIGPEMKGADVLVASLEREGVDVVYATPAALRWNCTRPDKERKDPNHSSSL